jgi:hypothetical protein
MKACKILITVFICISGFTGTSAAQCADPQDMGGVWNLLYAYSGNTDMYRYPADYGFTHQLGFSDPGILREYKDETLVATTTYAAECDSWDRLVITVEPTDPPIMPFDECAPYEAVFTDLQGSPVLLFVSINCFDTFVYYYEPFTPPVSVQPDAGSWGVIKLLYR